MNLPTSQRGSVLLSVVVAITLLAAISYMLNFQGAGQAQMTSGERERDRLRYIAEAGVAHARLQLAQNTSCEGYTDIPKTDFAGDSYTVKFSTAKDSPAKFSSTAESQDGAKFKLKVDDELAYQPPVAIELQLSKTGGQDTILDDFYPIRNYGGANYVQINSASWQQRPVLQFDLGKIPSGVRIVSAQLEVLQQSINNAGAVTVHRVTRDWLEGTRNGGGIADGATWESYDGTNAWQQPGGEFDATVYSVTQVSSAKSGGWVAWDIGDLVQDWVSGTLPNHGLLLAGDGTVTNAKFASKDTSDPLQAPKLTIVYACECGKTCGAAPPAGKNVLLVVVDPVILTAQETAKQTLIESWGHTVNLIDESASQGEFDAAVAVNDVAYVAEDINSGTLGTKLRAATIGVVIEEEKITDEFGISTSEMTFTESSIEITDNTHYITEPFSLGALAFASSVQPVGGRAGTLAPGLAVLAEKPSSTTSMLDVLETGGALADTGTAAGRRVKLPWGGNEFDINSLTDDGRKIMQRAIEWGAAAVVPAQPVAHWKFDEGLGMLAVDSAGGNDGTLQNGENWTTGLFDGALNFDGVDDAVSAGAPATLDDIFDGGGTLTAWIRPVGWGEGNYGRIADKSSATYPGNGWALELYGANSSFLFQTGFSTGTGSWITPNGSVSLDAWQHVALVYDTSSDANDPMIYIDGVAQAITELDTPSGTLRSDAGINFTIGNHAMSTVRTFDGALDDVRVYDRMLTAAEIAELATPPPATPIAHWKFDETSGTTASDSEGGHDGTLVGDASWAPGVLGGGLSLDGSGDRVDVSGLVNSPSSLTIAAWVNLSGAGVSGAEVVSLGNNILLRLDNAFYDTYGSFWDGSNWQRTSSSQSLAGSGWHHIAYTHDDAANQQFFYIDGAEAASTTFSTSISYTQASNTTIGAQATGNSSYDFNGQIDDLRIYDVALTAAEIAELAAMGGGGGGGGGGGSGGGGSGCDGNFRDNFDARSLAGSDGTLSWATDWIEVGESNGATSGDIQVMNDQSNYQLRTRDNDNGGEGVEREVDLTGAASATLNYDYRRMNLDNSNDYTSVEVSANGEAGPWAELTRHSGAGNDSGYQPASHPITAYISANTRIRFKTSSTMGNTDTVWFDNVEITCTP